MKRLSVVLFASAVLFGMASCQAMDIPMPMEVESIEPDSSTQTATPITTQAATQAVVSYERRVIRSGVVTEDGGDFLAGL